MDMYDAAEVELEDCIFHQLQTLARTASSSLFSRLCTLCI